MSNYELPQPEDYSNDDDTMEEFEQEIALRSFLIDVEGIEDQIELQREQLKQSGFNDPFILAQMDAAKEQIYALTHTLCKAVKDGTMRHFDPYEVDMDTIDPKNVYPYDESSDKTAGPLEAATIAGFSTGTDLFISALRLPDTPDNYFIDRDIATYEGLSAYGEDGNYVLPARTKIPGVFVSLRFAPDKVIADQVILDINPHSVANLPSSQQQQTDHQ